MPPKRKPVGDIRGRRGRRVGRQDGVYIDTWLPPPPDDGAIRYPFPPPPAYMGLQQAQIFGQRDNSYPQVESISTMLAKTNTDGDDAFRQSASFLGAHDFTWANWYNNEDDVTVDRARLNARGCYCNCHSCPVPDTENMSLTEGALMETNTAGATVGPGTQNTATPSIPENPTNKQLYELMSSTQTMLQGFQQTTDLRLKTLESKASSNDVKLGEMSQNIETNRVQISSNTVTVHSIDTENKRLNGILKSALERINELEMGLNWVDRTVRDNNLRVLNVPEEEGEKCVLKIATVIQNNSYTGDRSMSLESVLQSIEYAHRVGKEVIGKPRTMLVKFHSKDSRDCVISACKKKGGKSVEGCVFLDDRTQPDRTIHARNVPIMQKWFAHDGTKIFYKYGKFRVRGVWYSEADFKKLRPTA